MNEAIHFHTQDGSLLCGGYYGSHDKFCSAWNSDSGIWNWKFISLPRIRLGHTSWTPQSGVGTYLMGGESSYRDTTDLVKPDGTVQQGFNLKYDTRSNIAFFGL